MWFLFLQIWVWLLVAFALGWLAHWFLCCRNKDEKPTSDDLFAAYSKSVDASSEPSNAAVVANAVQESEAVESAELSSGDDWKPVLFSSAPDQVDELKRIKGVGQVLEKTLHDLGVYQFQQIADWTDEHVKWMDNFLSFTGRIDREDWRAQAKILADGGKTEFAQRVDQKEIDY